MRVIGEETRMWLIFFFCSIYSLVFIVYGDKGDGQHSGLPAGKVKAEPLFGTLVGPVGPNRFRAASRRREGLPPCYVPRARKRSPGHIRGRDGQEVASDDG